MTGACEDPRRIGVSILVSEPLPPLLWALSNRARLCVALLWAAAIQKSNISPSSHGWASCCTMLV